MNAEDLPSDMPSHLPLLNSVITSWSSYGKGWLINREAKIFLGYGAIT